MTLLLVGQALAGKDGTFWMPPQSSTLAPTIDNDFYLVYWSTVILFILLMGATIYLAIAYRQKSENQRTHPTKGSHSLELIWASIPTVMSVVIFVMGLNAYIDSSVPPADSIDVRVIGQKWSWYYQYPDLGIESDTLIAPADTNVRLTMYSKDVLHSFFVPDFRIKHDVVPNRYTALWFNAPEPGKHVVYCTEFCGDGHSVMLSEVEVVPQERWDRWVEGKQNTGPLTGVALGEDLFAKKGCGGCHSTDGARLVGPPLNDLMGKEEPLEV